MVFFELGYDLVSSNVACTIPQLEKSLYGIMLANTPRAFMHLLNNCIYTMGKTTYVDFLPFFNPNSGSELNIFRIIIQYKKFELLTHPLCELFLHLKWLRARSLYWIVISLNVIFTLLTIVYVLLSYGNMVNYFKEVPANETLCFDGDEKNSIPDGNSSDKDGGLHYLNSSNYHCYGVLVKPPLITFASLMILVLIAKMFQV